MTVSLRCPHSIAIAACLAGAAIAQDNSTTPSVEQALSLTPIQAGVDYAKPSADDAKRCKISADRKGKASWWVVRDASGRLLRKFTDSNGDNVVDTWSYYLDGLEVYRDIDSDFDSKADQYRWLQTGGSRWALDDNEDGKIDRWKQISPHEVAEEAVLAVQTKDAARFERLLITKAEVSRLGIGKKLGEQITRQSAAAGSEFSKLTRSQKIINGESRFIDFGAARPGTIPAGADGSKSDVTLYENAAALIDTGGKPEQLALGTLVRVGDAWKLVAAPTAGDGGADLASVFSVASFSPPPAAAGNEEVQNLMGALEKLDRQSATAAPAQRGGLTDQRVALLEKLAAASTDREEARQWYLQLAGLLNAAAQTEGYAKGVSKLASLEKSAGVQRVGADLAAHFRFQRIGAEYGVAYSDPKADYAKLQASQIEDLEGFIKAYPTSPDAADAMLQLGNMAGEFAGDDKVAEKWYRQAAAEFPKTPSGKKAAGALRRLGSIGKTIPLTGPTLSGKRADLARPPYRGKHVLIHYWTTWSGPEGDLAQVAAVRKKYAGKFEVLGVNLDSDPTAAKAFAAKQRTPWEHLYDQRGIDGERANQLGVINLPLMLLVDERGRVVNRNLHAGELETELQRLLR